MSCSVVNYSLVQLSTKIIHFVQWSTIVLISCRLMSCSVDHHCSFLSGILWQVVWCDNSTWCLFYYRGFHVQSSRWGIWCDIHKTSEWSIQWPRDHTRRQRVATALVVYQTVVGTTDQWLHSTVVSGPRTSG